MIRPRACLPHLLLTFVYLASGSLTLGADEPAFTEEQKIDFLQHAKIIDSKSEKKGKSSASHLTLSDGKVTYDASFQPIDEKKIRDQPPTEGSNSISGIIGDTTLPVTVLQSFWGWTTWFPYIPSANGTG